jgi:hypothetical protein
VRRSLGAETLRIVTWSCQQIRGGIGGLSAGHSTIHRYSGRAHIKAATLEWSLILKTLYPPDEPGQSSDYEYWRREAHAYESGLLDDLPGGLFAPRCFGVANQPGGECYIWMEDVADEFGSGDDIGPDWPLEHYGIVAQHPGQFNGTYLAGQPIPSFSWLRRSATGYLRQRVAGAARGITRLGESLDDPLMHRLFPSDRVDFLMHMWAEHEDYLNALDRMPPTLCHGDAFRRNLFARATPSGTFQTGLIDWASVGMGWAGSEIGSLVRSTLVFGEVGWSEANELDRIAFQGYLEGLRDAGWRGDPRRVRFGFVAPFAVAFLRRPGAIFRRFVDGAEQPPVGEVLSLSPEERLDLAGEYIHFVFGLGQEARELRDAL